MLPEDNVLMFGILVDNQHLSGLIDEQIDLHLGIGEGGCSKETDYHIS